MPNGRNTTRPTSKMLVLFMHPPRNDLAIDRSVFGDARQVGVTPIWGKQDAFENALAHALRIRFDPVLRHWVRGRPESGAQGFRSFAELNRRNIPAGPGEPQVLLRTR